MEKKLIRSFEDLLVWQKAIEFVTHVYLVTNQGELKRDFGLRDQMRRAAVSIPTNMLKDSSVHRERSI
jgi:four helix bundle protein